MHGRLRKARWALARLKCFIDFGSDLYVSHRLIFLSHWRFDQSLSRICACVFFCISPVTCLQLAAFPLTGLLMALRPLQLSFYTISSAQTQALPLSRTGLEYSEFTKQLTSGFGQVTFLRQRSARNVPQHVILFYNL